jgi:hypothetical protein
MSRCTPADLGWMVRPFINGFVLLLAVAFDSLNKRRAANLCTCSDRAGEVERQSAGGAAGHRGELKLVAVAEHVVGLQ